MLSLSIMSLIVIILSLFVFIWHSRKRPRFEVIPDITSEIDKLRSEGKGILDLRHINRPNYHVEQHFPSLKSALQVDIEFNFQPLTAQQQDWLSTGKLVGICWPENSGWGLIGLAPASSSQLINSPVGKLLQSIAFPPAKKCHRKSQTTTKPTEVKGIRLRGQVLTVFFAEEYSWEELGKFAENRQKLKSELLKLENTPGYINLHNPIMLSVKPWYILLGVALFGWHSLLPPATDFWTFSWLWIWSFMPAMLCWKFSNPLLQWFARYQLSPEQSASDLKFKLFPFFLMWSWLLFQECNLMLGPDASQSKDWYILTTTMDGKKGPYYAELLAKDGGNRIKLPIQFDWYKYLQGGESVKITNRIDASGKLFICRIEIEKQLYYQFPLKQCH